MFKNRKVKQRRMTVAHHVMFYEPPVDCPESGSRICMMEVEVKWYDMVMLEMLFC